MLFDFKQRKAETTHHFSCLIFFRLFFGFLLIASHLLGRLLSLAPRPNIPSAGFGPAQAPLGLLPIPLEIVIEGDLLTLLYGPEGEEADP